MTMLIKVARPLLRRQAFGRIGYGMALQAPWPALLSWFEHLRYPGYKLTLTWLLNERWGNGIYSSGCSTFESQQTWEKCSNGIFPARLHPRSNRFSSAANSVRLHTARKANDQSKSRLLPSAIDGLFSRKHSTDLTSHNSTSTLLSVPPKGGVNPLIIALHMPTRTTDATSKHMGRNAESNR